MKSISYYVEKIEALHRRCEFLKPKFYLSKMQEYSSCLNKVVKEEYEYFCEEDDFELF